MAGGALGPWDPLSLSDTVALFTPARFRWWISGGRALDLHVGRSWRSHGDTDVGLVRRDATDLRRVLAGWDVHIAAAGRLEVWKGQEPLADRSQNNLWCRREPTEPWSIDITVADGDRDAWVYRRDPSLRIPWEQAVLTSDQGVPYLAPELQLLFKSSDVRAKDDIDAREVIPVLEPPRHHRLAQLLPPTHPWQDVLLGRT